MAIVRNTVTIVLHRDLKALGLSLQRYLGSIDGPVVQLA
jgi:hypothetical protein